MTHTPDAVLTVLASAAENGGKPPLTLYTAGATIKGTAMPFAAWIAQMLAATIVHAPDTMQSRTDLPSQLEMIQERHTTDAADLTTALTPDSARPVCLYFTNATVTAPDGTKTEHVVMRVPLPTVTAWHLDTPDA